MMAKCKIENCQGENKAHGLCGMHYQRQRKGMDLFVPKRTLRGAHDAWIEQHVDFSGDDCLIWPFARQYGVTKHCIWGIVHLRSWKWAA
jgi:hypothetical protein